MSAGDEASARALARARWMSALAQADPAMVEAAWGRLPARPFYRLLRAPEIGLVMVQGRAGGTGLHSTWAR